MKVLLDAHVGHLFRESLSNALGLPDCVYRAADFGWATLQNGALQKMASADGFTHLITYDKDMANKHPPHIDWRWRVRLLGEAHRTGTEVDMAAEVREPSFHRENTGGSIGAAARRLAPCVKATLKWVWSFLSASFALVVGTCAMVASAGWGSLPLALATMLLVVVTALRVHVMGWPYRS